MENVARSRSPPRVTHRQTLPIWDAARFANGPADSPMPRTQTEWLAPLPPGVADHSAESPSLVLHLLQKPNMSETAIRCPGLVLVIPGGGMMFRSTKESDCVCSWLNSLGLHAVLVNYRVQRRFPAAFLDARRAVQLARSHAAEWGADPERIGVMGFSAGGHLAAMLAAAWDFPDELGAEGAETDGVCGAKAVDARPDFVVLGYPVITGSGDICGVVPQDTPRGRVGRLQGGDPRPLRHHSTCAVLLGEEPNGGWPSAALRKVSAELWVRSDPMPPPTFIFHTADDATVLGPHALRFALALSFVGAPYALHVFTKGVHGIGLADGDDAGTVAAWRTLCKEWLQEGLWLSSTICS